MQNAFKHIISITLAINILMFSAGVSLVDYYCGSCTHHHKEILFPVEHLAHKHVDGHCLLSGEEHNHEHHAEHQYFKLKDLQFSAKKAMQFKAPVVDILFQKTMIQEEMICHKQIKHAVAGIPDPPDILHTTSILLL